MITGKTEEQAFSMTVCRTGDHAGGIVVYIAGEQGTQTENW
jgi:hypothetical protein